MKQSKQTITIKFQIFDSIIPELEEDKLPVEERAERIAQFVSDELVTSGSAALYEILDAEEVEL